MSHLSPKSQLSRTATCATLPSLDDSVRHSRPPSRPGEASPASPSRSITTLRRQMTRKEVKRDRSSIEREAALQAAKVSDKLSPEEEYGGIFDRADTEKKGFMSPQDVEAFVLGLSREERADHGIGKWRDFLKEADLDGNGIVDREEFILYFTKANLLMAKKNAEIFLMREQYDMALQMAQAAIQADNTTVGPWLICFEVHMKKKMWKEAMEDMTNAIEMNERESYWFQRACARLEMNDYEGAVEDAEKALELDGMAFRNRFVIAKAYFWLERYEDSITEITECLARDQTNAEYYWRRAAAKLALGNTRGAIDDASEAIIFLRKDANAWIIRARARQLRRDDIGCIRDSTQAIKFDPRRSEPWLYRACSKAELKLWDEAIPDCEEAVRLNPDSQEAWALLGRARSTFKDFDGTIESCGRAILLDNTDVVSYYYSGCSRYAKGQYDESIWECEQALKKKAEIATDAKKLIKKAQRAVVLCSEWKPLPDIARHRLELGVESGLRPEGRALFGIS